MCNHNYNGNEAGMKNRSHSYDINETWPSHGHKYESQYDYGYIY